jgi:two-component system cell cycle sensor histidine kinase/response regulator CckA
MTAASSINIPETPPVNTPGESQTPPAALAAPSAAEQKAPDVNPTVLLVDDDQPVLVAARRILARSGFTVIEGHDGVDGIQVAKHHQGPIDLILTDVFMPRMGGRKMVQCLTSVCPSAKVIYMSGFLQDETRRRQLVEPDKPFLQKPFSVDGLINAVRGVLSGQAGAAIQAA